MQSCFRDSVLCLCLEKKRPKGGLPHFMSSELAYAEQGGGKLTFEALPWLRFCDTKLDNVTFCQSGGLRKYALLTFPKRGFLNQPYRVEEMYERWMKLWPLNRYVAMKQFYGAIKDTDDGRAFLVMDYFPGGSLDDPRVIDSLSPTEKMILDGYAYL